MKKYVCTVCGYIYDEAAGDPDNGVEPGTKLSLIHIFYLPSGSMLPYWNYFEQEEFVPRWGKVVFKYFSSRVMQRILLDMCGVMDGTDQGETAAEFCDYFCAINRLSAEQAQTKATADE